MKPSENSNTTENDRFGFDWAAISDYLKVKYPLSPKSIDREDIHYVNMLYTKGYDKWYRMFCGSGSNLRSYQNGLVELEVHCRHSLYTEKRQIILNQIHSWRFSSWLAAAERYIVHVYATRVPAGFVTDVNQLQTAQVTEMIQEMSGPNVKIKIDEITGDWRELLERS